MTASQQITEILNSCGCKPTATTDKSGNTIIKVNAPELSKEAPQKNENLI